MYCTSPATGSTWPTTSPARPLPRLNENLADKSSWPTQHLHQISTRSSRRTTTVCILLSCSRLLITSRLTALRERLEHTKATANRIEFSSLVQDVAKLRKTLIDAIPLLPLYDQRQAELVGGLLHTYHLQSRALIYGPFLQVVGSLEQELEVARAQILSPAAASGSGKAGGRFAFRRTEPVAAPKAVAVAPTTAVRASDAPSIESRALSLANRTYEYLCSGDLPAEQSLERGEHDLSLSNLSHCIVDFVSRPNNEGLGRIRALYARNVTRCVLIMPIIEGSVLLYEFKDCTIVLGCHQVREAASEQLQSLTKHPVSYT